MRKFSEFWNIVVNVWQNGLYGIDIGRIIIAVVIIFSFILIRRLFKTFVISRLKKLTRKTETQFDDETINALEKPLELIPVVLGVFLSTEYLHLKGDFQLIAGHVVRSLIVFCIFWGLVNMVWPLSFLLKRLENIFSTSMVEWLVKAIRLSFVFIGTATILEIWGIKVGPIIAGLGLFGVAVALGAQDLFKNLISGILIIAEHRFKPGDWIRVDGVVEGTVEIIGFRSTRVRRFDKAPVFVPNAKLSDNSVINFSAMTFRRIYWKVGVEYRTSIDQLRQIRENIEAYILNDDDFAKPPVVPMFVRIDGFNDSSIDIMIYCFTKTTNWGEWLKIKEFLAYRIKEIVETAGSAFAFPSQSLYIETVPGETPEIFIPPRDTPPKKVNSI